MNDSYSHGSDPPGGMSGGTSPSGNCLFKQCTGVLPSPLLSLPRVMILFHTPFDCLDLLQIIADCCPLTALVIDTPFFLKKKNKKS